MKHKPKKSIRVNIRVSRRAHAALARLADREGRSIVETLDRILGV